MQPGNLLVADIMMAGMDVVSYTLSGESVARIAEIVGMASPAGQALFSIAYRKVGVQDTMQLLARFNEVVNVNVE